MLTVQEALMASSTVALRIVAPCYNAKESGSGEAGELEAGLLAALLWRLREAWDARARDMMRMYLALGSRYVPGSEQIIKRWRLKSTALWMLRFADRLPAPVSNGVRRVARTVVRR